MSEESWMSTFFPMSRFSLTDNGDRKVQLNASAGAKQSSMCIACQALKEGQP